ncbi:toxin-antitoxin system HicB family antitoxin [Burkholderia gladioli]|uniref:toxin-antitoxin system HicB family antitoxin n=1 Tax=Burkholderia gladioli TaxID=28095 RepID=UPI001641A6F1|nr:toxin-antitoxin system HicB family antitoxin [Burkholderia gladioli]
MLSVRIRPSLHARLSTAAQLRGVSLTTLVERLIEENLFEDVTAQRKLQNLQATAHAQKFQLEMLETLVLNATEPGESDAASLLTSIRDLILRCREVRVSSQEKIEEWRHAHAQMLASSPPRQRHASPFDGLGAANEARVDLSQLPLPERRRQHLRQALNGSPKGTRARLAYALGVSASYFSQMLSGPKNPGGRSINDEKARMLEVELGLPNLALDAIEPQSDIVSIQKAVLELESVLREIKPPAVRSNRKRTDH